MINVTEKCRGHFSVFLLHETKVDLLISARATEVAVVVGNFVYLFICF